MQHPRGHGLGSLERRDHSVLAHPTPPTAPPRPPFLLVWVLAHEPVAIRVVVAAGARSARSARSALEALLALLALTIGIGPPRPEGRLLRGLDAHVARARPACALKELGVAQLLHHRRALRLRHAGKRRFLLVGHRGERGALGGAHILVCLPLLGRELLELLLGELRHARVHERGRHRVGGDAHLLLHEAGALLGRHLLVCRSLLGRHRCERRLLSVAHALVQSLLARRQGGELGCREALAHHPHLAQRLGPLGRRHLFEGRPLLLAHRREGRLLGVRHGLVDCLLRLGQLLESFLREALPHGAVHPHRLGSFGGAHLLVRLALRLRHVGEDGLLLVAHSLKESPLVGREGAGHLLHLLGRKRLRWPTTPSPPTLTTTPATPTTPTRPVTAAGRARPAGGARAATPVAAARPAPVTGAVACEGKDLLLGGLQLCLRLHARALGLDERRLLLLQHPLHILHLLRHLIDARLAAPALPTPVRRASHRSRSLGLRHPLLEGSLEIDGHVS